MKKIGDIVAFIPLRGESKSIPNKNIKYINGRPLVYWVLDAAVNCDEIDIVVVSIDSVEIKNIVSNYNSDKILIIERSESVSTDTASTESVMLEFASNFDFKDIILIQATSPLLKTENIYEGLVKYQQYDSVLSVVTQKRFIWESHDKTSIPINYNPVFRPRRQDFKGYLVENGAFYITSKKRLLETSCRVSGEICTVEMPDESYFEIDEPSDWIIVESLLRRDRKEQDYLSNKLGKIKCLLTDCDGVLTDGGMYYSENGDELKKFNTKDGMGFKLLKKLNFITGIITGEKIELVRRRAEKLKLDVIYLGVDDKMEILSQIFARYFGGKIN